MRQINRLQVPNVARKLAMVGNANARAPADRTALAEGEIAFMS